MAIVSRKKYTPDGFEIVFISDHTFSLLEKGFSAITRLRGDASIDSPIVAVQYETVQL